MASLLQSLSFFGSTVVPCVLYKFLFCFLSRRLVVAFRNIKAFVPQVLCTRLGCHIPTPLQPSSEILLPQAVVCFAYWSVYGAFVHALLRVMTFFVVPDANTTRSREKYEKKKAGHKNDVVAPTVPRARAGRLACSRSRTKKEQKHPEQNGQMPSP